MMSGSVPLPEENHDLGRMLPARFVYENTFSLICIKMKLFAPATRQVQYLIQLMLPMAMEPMPDTSTPTAPADAASMERFIEDYLLYLLARASHLVSSEFHRELRRRGISVPVWRVLASLVGSRSGETVTGLAEVCLLQQPTMTKLLDRMVRDGLVRRSQDGRDRRVVRVELTPRGEAIALDLVKAAKQHETEVLARHPEAESMALKDLLRSIMHRHDNRSSRRG
jgi:DNA-binding MarR family transcriptional regulator